MRLVVLALAATACRDASAQQPAIELDPAPPGVMPTGINPRLLRRFKAVVKPTTANEEIELGKRLFFDPRLSRNGKVSCSTCHVLGEGGDDGQSISTGIDGRHGRRNTPTVYNSARNVAQFWDGRAGDLTAQVKGPLLSPTEMDMGEPSRVTRALRSIPGYAPLFAAAFPGEADAVDFDHAAEAIAAFEATLITPSRWDRYLGGDTTALTATELDGLRVFGNLGCVQCHTGELVGGKMFQVAGTAAPWPNQRDQGRYELTHQASDRMMFKVPSLRNVALTAPYFHDGSISDLGVAIKMMGAFQLGIDISDRDVAAIAAWLAALTGDVGAVAAPRLP